MAKLNVPPAAQNDDPSSGPPDAPRYQQGWRSGKPVEDPEKMKRWGFVSARPSEYLVCIRGGQVDARRSGQGARVFKWPWEQVAVIPTTLQHIEFVADQVTRERVGVRVSGIAVYRIAHPELACRVLNFSYAERASEKLAATLVEMFIGAARRLIANLSLDECLTRRKEAIATFLLEEIAPVLAGRGAAEDTTDQGWGVVLDTIEIKDVRILSGSVFAHLQAPYRAEIATRAEVAELDRQRQVAERKTETTLRAAEVELRAHQESRLLKARSEAETAEGEAAEQVRVEQARARAQTEALVRRELLERKQAEVEVAGALRKAEGEATVAARRQALAEERARAELRAAAERRAAAAAAEAAALQAEESIEAARHEAEVRRLQAERARLTLTTETELTLRKARVQVELELRRADADTREGEDAVTLRRERAAADIEQLLTQGRALRELVTQGLPQIAAALKHGPVGTLHYTQLGGDADGPLASVASGLTQVLAVARGLGLDLSRLSQPPAQASEPAPAQPKGGPGARQAP